MPVSFGESVSMNKSHWIDNCPDCDEVLRQFYLKKAFIPEHTARSGWSGVEGYFCPGCDTLLIALGFDSDDRETFWAARSSSGDFVIPSVPPGRGHPCYNAGAIRSAAASSSSAFSLLRGIRADIGPRRRPDDPRLTLAISSSQADVSPVYEMLKQWLANTKSGTVAAQAGDSDGTLLHLELSEPVRARYMVDRLIRKFSLSHNAKLYAYNEGRRYKVFP